MNEKLKHLGQTIIPDRYHDWARTTYLRSISAYQRLMARKLPLDRMLWGDESGIPAAKYARLTRNLGRPSTPLSRTPHVKLLEYFSEKGKDLLISENLTSTDYYINARVALDLTGHYFSCKSEEDINNHVLIFLRLYDSGDIADQRLLDSGYTLPGFPIVLRRIRKSGGYYQVVDGHHRLAIAYCRGESTINAYVLPEAPVYTPLQQLLLGGLWTGGDRVLYQPIAAPEVQAKWKLVRKCSDRFDKILGWLRENDFQGGDNSFIDLGSSYGWFVNEMGRRGYDSWGVERDISAIETGHVAYGLDVARIHCQELVRFLRTDDRTFDIVTCFSVLHHFALGMGAIPPEEFMKLIDRCTRKVLFLDTGQSHEQWFKNRLTAWDVDFIEDWIKRNSSFKKVVRLGPDEDNVGSFENNYGRMLFACTK